MVSVLFWASSCSKEAGQSPTLPRQDLPEYTAHVESSDVGSRTTLNSAYDILWAAGDQIAVFNKTSVASLYQLEEGAGTKQGKFKSPTSSQTSASEEAVSGAVLSHNGAIYPYAQGATMTEAGEHFVFEGLKLPATQYYIENTLPAARDNSSVGCLPMIAVSSSHALQFKNIGAAIKLQLKSGDVENHRLASIILTARTADDKGESTLPLAGQLSVKVDKEGQNPTITIASETSNAIELKIPNVTLSKSQATNFYIAVPPVTFPHGFQLVVKDNYGHEMILKSQKATTLNRNALLIMPQIAYKAGTWGSIDDIIIQ